MANESRTCFEDLKLNPCICSAQLYTAGTSIEEIQRRYGLQEVIKQASNENALGPSPLAVEAMQKTLASINRYPPAADDELRAKLANTLPPAVVTSPPRSLPISLIAVNISSSLVPTATIL